MGSMDLHPSPEEIENIREENREAVSRVRDALEWIELVLLLGPATVTEGSTSDAGSARVEDPLGDIETPPMQP